MRGIETVSIVVQFKCLLPVINGLTYLCGVFNDVEVVVSCSTGDMKCLCAQINYSSEKYVVL